MQPALQGYVFGGRSPFMRKLILTACCVSLAIIAYALWPLVSALQIKQAIKDGDVATLERKVQWIPVRASLKASLAELSPAMQITGDETRLSHGQRMPSIWSRVKAAAAPIVTDRLIDAYVTAEGLTKLHQVKNGTFLSVFGLTPPVAQPATPKKTWFWSKPPATDEPLAVGAHAPEASNPIARFVNLLQRVERARFHSMSVAEFEIADKQNPARRFVSKFELSGFEWKLASVKIVGEGF